VKERQGAFSAVPTAIEKFMNSEQPSSPIIAVASGLLLVPSIFYMQAVPHKLEPWQITLSILRQNLPDLNMGFWLAIVLVYAFWPISAIVAHLLGRLWKTSASFGQELHIIGKLWLLGWMIFVYAYLIPILFTSIGWHGIAQIWNILWSFILFFESLWAPEIAAKAMYGQDIKRAFLKMFIVLLVTIALYLFVPRILYLLL
jgi:hypothetical protein